MNDQVNMFRRKQRPAPLRQMKRGFFVSKRETPGIKIQKKEVIRP